MVAADTSSDYAFQAVRVVSPSAKWFGLLFLVIGLSFSFWMGLPLLRGETVTMSVNDGPMQEYGPGDPTAWGPAVIGLVFALVGGALTWFALRPPRAVRCVAGELGLTITDEKGNSTTHDWSSFTGEVSRLSRGKQGAVMTFGLKSSVRQDRRVRQETVELAGIADPEEAQRQILARIR